MTTNQIAWLRTERQAARERWEDTGDQQAWAIFATLNRVLTAFGVLPDEHDDSSYAQGVRVTAERAGLSG